MKRIRKLNEYGIFRTIAQLEDIKRNVEIQFVCHEWGDEIIIYQNGIVLDNWNYEDEESYDYYKENNEQIVIYGFNYEVVIDKKDMVRIDKITDRKDYIIEAVCNKKGLNKAEEIVEIDKLLAYNKRLIEEKGYTREQLKEIIERYL